MRKTALKRQPCCGGCAPQPTEPDKRARRVNGSTVEAASMDLPPPMRHVSGGCAPLPPEAFMRRITKRKRRSSKEGQGGGGEDHRSCLKYEACDKDMLKEDRDSQATGSGRNSMPATSPNMFPMRVFQIAPCGTYLIPSGARDWGTYTVKDCRTEQRARWDKIRWRAQMQREQEERKATVQRWKERSRMKREDKDVVDGMMADGRVPDDGP